MKLQIVPRDSKKKSELTRVRLEDNIPAVIYNRGKESEPITINGSEWNAFFRTVPSGRLSSTVLTLVDQNGKVRRVVVKDIQYEITTYKVIHLDFEELHDDVKVSLRVPIECSGVVDCVGVKLGGVVRQVVRSLRVRCFPRDIPAFFDLDVRSMELFQAKRLADLNIPENVHPLTNLDTVAVVIVKR